ncbi:PucR family transcriptional regulator [Streptomyces armeniacus]|uniref:PucR family transcriptional regulator n=1 Tax=Streptomyces armeniacus TaxID=83291 RepID=A0A345XM44_9ACTN|nr:PucR family transcriptional regulator [Streptomyces armeniacus]AXK32710.1 PucR family transcriptional regulator [Streptomyces armeniacus]
MPLSVRELVARREFGLTVAAGGAGLDRTISWVHASEVPDPTPWLEEGSFVLVTGIGHPGPESVAGTARRLAETGAAGIGIAVDLVYAEVPSEVVRAGAETGLPVLTVPYTTPFVALAQAVASRIATEERSALQRALHVYPRLTAAALERGAVPGITRELAREYGGWAAVVGPADEVLAVAPETAAAEAARTAAGLTWAGQSLSVMEAGGHLVGHTLGAGTVRGRLLLWRGTPFARPDYTVAAAAASLVTYDLEQRRRARAEGHRASAEAVREALGDRADAVTAARLLASWGLDPRDVTVIVLGAPPADGLHDTLTDHEPPVLATYTDRGEAVLLTSHPADVLGALGDPGSPLARACPGAAGASESVSAEGLAQGLRQARQALAIGAREGRHVTLIRDLGAIELLLGSAEQSVPDLLLDRLVEPLRRAEEERGVPLIATVRAFLDHNGSLAQASAELGVHRHTLHHRLGVVRQVLGRDLDSAYVRLELALALQAHALREDGTG